MRLEFYSCMLPAAISHILTTITQKIVAEFQPEKIILFGSYAWGTPGPDSDLDLLVVQEGSRTQREMMREMGRSLWGVGIPTDVLVYTPAQLQKGIHEERNLFLKDIVTNGMTLYVHDSLRA